MNYVIGARAIFKYVQRVKIIEGIVINYFALWLATVAMCFITL